MIVAEDRSLMKNKQFMGAFLFGLMCALAGLIVRIILNESSAQCIEASFCSGGSSLCIESGYAYCCGGGYGEYSCKGSYYNCERMGYNYMDCSGYIIAEWVLFSISVVVLVILIVLAKKHKSRNMAMVSFQRQHNIIYSDSNNANVGNARVGLINDSIANDGIHP